jgi:hypothetical protein
MYKSPVAKEAEKDVTVEEKQGTLSEGSKRM